MVYGVQDPNAMYNKYGVNGFYNQYGLYNNQSPSIFGNGYGQTNGDDGKISFGEKVGSFFKGIGKSIVNGVKSIFTPKGLLKTALTIGACMIPGIGPVIGMGLAVAGVAKGATTVLKGAAQASAATTDAEAKAAWENIGGGAFTTAASAVGVKGAAKAIGNMNKAAAASGGVDVSKATGLAKAKGTLQNAKTTFDKSSLGKSVTKVTTAYKNGDKLTGKLKDAGTAAKEELKTGYTSVKDKYAASKTATKAAKDAKKASDTVAQNNDKIADLQKQLDKCDDAAQKIDLEKQIETLRQQNSKANLQANKTKYMDKYEQQADGSYKSKATGETISKETYDRNIERFDAKIAENTPSIQKAQANATKANQALDDFEKTYNTKVKKDVDGVESYVSKDGKSTISVKEYETLKTKANQASDALKQSRTSYAEAQQATAARAEALQIKNNRIANAKKMTDAKARKAEIDAANKQFEAKINEELGNFKSDAAKDALRGETSMTKNIFGGFKRGTVANGWDLTGAGSMALANHLEEANSEYEMYNQYLQSVANSNTGYSA